MFDFLALIHVWGVSGGGVEMQKGGHFGWIAPENYLRTLFFLCQNWKNEILEKLLCYLKFINAQNDVETFHVIPFPPPALYFLTA